MARFGAGFCSDLYVERLRTRRRQNACLACFFDFGAGSVGHHGCHAEARDESDYKRTIISVVLLGDGGFVSGGAVGCTSALAIGDGDRNLLDSWGSAERTWRMDELSCTRIGWKGIHRDLARIPLSATDSGARRADPRRTPYSSSDRGRTHGHRSGNSALHRDTSESLIGPDQSSFPGRIQPSSAIPPIERRPSCTENNTVVERVSPGARTRARPESVID